MINIYSKLIRPLLFSLDAETAHHLTLTLLEFAAQLKISPLIYGQKNIPHRVMGLDFPNPVGLAAGLDKNATCLNGMSSLGFGFIEVGTITPKPQAGNPKPRLFRLPQAEALINRMGFNNDGLDACVKRIAQFRHTSILGVNIGKNKDTSNDAAINDYLLGYQSVYPYADYVTVNLSSPNTQGLRDLQHGTMRDELFKQLKELQVKLADQTHRYVPLVIKIAPDLNDEELKDVGDALLNYQMDGVIATNTTIARTNVEALPHGTEAGGLSGKPLQVRATRVVGELYQHLGDQIPIIASGGVMSADAAMEKFQAGAKLIQIYTGLIYEGPKLIKDILGRLEPM